MRTALQVDEIEIADACEPSQVMESQQALAQVVDVLAQLRTSTRKAFLLDRVELYSNAQIAARLGVTVSMVEKHIKFAMVAFETTGIEQPRTPAAATAKQPRRDGTASRAGPRRKRTPAAC